MDAQTRNELAGRFGAIASQAGELIMAIYADAPRIETKADGSPVSDADRESERLIREQLSKLLPSVPLIAEESFDPQQCRQAPDRSCLSIRSTARANSSAAMASSRSTSR
jgi:3'-phosphoadenosine 5'-phosphosulfate (PAPS) 3'-phosphatase